MTYTRLCVALQCESIQLQAISTKSIKLTLLAFTMKTTSTTETEKRIKISFDWAHGQRCALQKWKDICHTSYCCCCCKLILLVLFLRLVCFAYACLLSLLLVGQSFEHLNCDWIPFSSFLFQEYGVSRNACQPKQRDWGNGKEMRNPRNVHS